MSLKANATFTFRGYEITESGMTLRFTVADPGPGEPTDYLVTITDTDLGTITNAADFRALVMARLSRRARGTGIAAKLDAFVGQSVTL